MSDSLRPQRLQPARLLCTLWQHHLIVIIPLLSLHHHPLHSSQTANRIGIKMEGKRQLSVLCSKPSTCFSFLSKYNPKALRCLQGWLPSGLAISLTSFLTTILVPIFFLFCRHARYPPSEPLGIFPSVQRITGLLPCALKYNPTYSEIPYSSGPSKVASPSCCEDHFTPLTSSKCPSQTVLTLFFCS